MLLVEQRELCSLATVPEDQANRLKGCMTTYLAAKCKSLVFNYGLRFLKVCTSSGHTLGAFPLAKGLLRGHRPPKGSMIRLNY